MKQHYLDLLAPLPQEEVEQLFRTQRYAKRRLRLFMDPFLVQGTFGNDKDTIMTTARLLWEQSKTTEGYDRTLLIYIKDYLSDVHSAIHAFPHIKNTNVISRVQKAYGDMAEYVWGLAL